MENYIKSKLHQHLNYIGDLQRKNGYYYFTVCSIGEKVSIYENSIFEVVSIDPTPKNIYIELKVESSYLESVASSESQFL